MASLRKIMLVLGESKKVATLPAPSGNAPDIEVITDAAKELFVISESEGKLLVQQYDDDFDEWIDINDDFVAKDKQKLKIVRHVCNVYISQDNTSSVYHAIII